MVMRRGELLAMVEKKLNEGFKIEIGRYRNLEGRINIYQRLSLHGFFRKSVFEY